MQTILRFSNGYSFFLFGARGTGKTTYIAAFDPDASWYVDLLDPEVEDRYRRALPGWRARSELCPQRWSGF